MQRCHLPGRPKVLIQKCESDYICIRDAEIGCAHMISCQSLFYSASKFIRFALRCHLTPKDEVLCKMGNLREQTEQHMSLIFSLLRAWDGISQDELRPFCESWRCPYESANRRRKSCGHFMERICHKMFSKFPYQTPL
uniref:BTB domain-containing protein n=1 Tax=Heterorhabditis bacteriophora TaxID=37862 RepID=A0A1I7X4C0_HETBA